mgnify:CR=1 FL=1
MSKVNLTINGQALAVDKGTTVLKAAQDAVITLGSKYL